MKPNQQQQILLQRYLGNKLQYRETYAEFYDHILTALETKPADGDFETATREIINNDFGGIDGMRLIEDKYQVSIFVEMRKKYFNYVAENLKLPQLIGFGLFTILIYCLAKQSWFNFLDFVLVFMAIRIVPGALQLSLRFGGNHLYGEPQKSIKYGFFRWLNRIPAIIIIAWLCSTKGAFNNPVWEQHMNPYAMTVFIALVAFHSFTFYKVYRDDIKTSFNAG